MSIFKLDSGYRVVADRFLLEGKPDERRNEIVKTMLRQNFRGNDYININDGSILKIATKNKELYKLERPGLPMNEFKYKIRQTAVTHLDELTEVSQFADVEQDYKEKHGSTVTGFEKRTVELELDNSNDVLRPLLYRIEMTVLCRASDKIIYDISRINKIDTYSSLLRLAKTKRITDIDKVSIHKKLSQLPGYVKTNMLEISKFIIDREPEDGDLRRLMAASRQERRACLAKDLKRHGFIPEKMVLDKMEALGGLLHCRVGVKEVNSWYKSRIFDGNDEVNGLIKNLAEDLRRQELYRGRLPPEGPVR